jgi:predicted DsbA family dithiol-disulfide isomerase
MSLVRIDISVDLVCPWCLIGLRELQRARAMLAAAAPEVRLDLQWHGVQLLPGVPSQGFPFREFYLQRLGGEAAMRQRQAQVTAAAQAAGATIDYSSISIMPNTADAHRVLELVARLGPDCQEALLERLLCAYFERGEDLSQSAVLLKHGAACGLDMAEMAGVLHGATLPYQGRHHGYGVPHFSIGGGPELSGAQPASVLVAAIEEARRNSAAAPA